MQFSGKLTEAELNDVRKLLRPRLYWLRWAGSNWYGLSITLVLVWATILGFVGRTKPNWGAVALIWAVLGGIVVFVWYKTWRKQGRELEKINVALPDQINLATDGVKLAGPNGASSFMPWTNFDSYREGQRVIVINQGIGRQLVMLPLGQHSEVGRAAIRQMLQSHIASISANF
jgi:hypothetical protein